MKELSPERVGRITGSRVAGILGTSPYTDRDGVMRSMVRERLGADPEFTGNIATEWGNQHEPHAIAEYERYRGVMVHADQQIVIHPSIDYLAVTPDGLVGETGLVEAKCPYKATYTTLDERPDYADQIQLQLEVTGRAWADFVVWRPSGLAVTRVERDPHWFPDVSDMLDQFIAEYETILHDHDRHAEYLDDLDPARDDFAWQIAALEYLEAHAALTRAEKARDNARGRLISLADGQPSHGAGVSVGYADRSGSIDYKAAVADLLGPVDLEPYRKPGKTVASVRVAS